MLARSSFRIWDRINWRKLFASRHPIRHIEPEFAPRYVDQDAAPVGLRRAILSHFEDHERLWLVLFALTSLLLHVLFVILILLFHGREQHLPPEIVPVKLVTLPPQSQQKQPEPPKQQEAQKPEQKKEQKQEQKQQPPPPHGPLASDELGDVNATDKVPTPDHTPAAGTPQPHPGEAPMEAGAAPDTPKPSDLAKPDQVENPDRNPSVAQEEVQKTPEQIAAGGQLAPPPPSKEPPKEESAKPTPKPAALHLRAEQGGAKKPTEHPDDPNQAEGHKAKYPGPDASSDQYLAYIRDLTNEHLAQVPSELLRNRSGVVQFDVRVWPSGKIAWISGALQSSGHPDLDHAIRAALETIDQFPPLPAELTNTSGEAVPLGLTLPIASLGRLH